MDDVLVDAHFLALMDHSVVCRDGSVVVRHENIRKGQIIRRQQAHAECERIAWAVQVHGRSDTMGQLTIFVATWNIFYIVKAPVRVFQWTDYWCGYIMVLVDHME